jgi:putative transposase
LCSVFGIKRAAFYKYLANTKTKKTIDLKKIVTMKAIAQKSRHSYGSRRMSKELKKRGFTGGRYATRTFMKKHGIISDQRPKKTYYGSTKIKVEGENILNRQFKVDAPNKVWSGDITYIKTKKGTLYLAGIVDLFSRKIIGFEMDNNMREELPLAALDNAIRIRKIKEKVLHHTDRGSQYVGEKYRSRLKEFAFIISLSKAGNCLDNSAIERVWGSLKSEWIKGKIYTSIAEAVQDVLKFIDFYNTERLHSTLGYVSPDDFEKRYYENLTNNLPPSKKVSTLT